MNDFERQFFLDPKKSLAIGAFFTVVADIFNFIAAYSDVKEEERNNNKNEKIKQEIKELEECLEKIKKYLEE